MNSGWDGWDLEIVAGAVWRLFHLKNVQRRLRAVEVELEQVAASAAIPLHAFLRQRVSLIKSSENTLYFICTCTLQYKRVRKQKQSSSTSRSIQQTVARSSHEAAMRWRSGGAERSGLCN